MGRRTARIDYELPVVHRDHHAAPHLTDAQGLDALRVGRELQVSSAALAAQHAREYTDSLRRRRVFRLSALVLALEIGAGIAVVGRDLGWWPS